MLIIVFYRFHPSYNVQLSSHNNVRLDTQSQDLLKQIDWIILGLWAIFLVLNYLYTLLSNQNPSGFEVELHGPTQKASISSQKQSARGFSSVYTPFRLTSSIAWIFPPARGKHMHTHSAGLRDRVQRGLRSRSASSTFARARAHFLPRRGATFESAPGELLRTGLFPPIFEDCQTAYCGEFFFI